jgi:hypothetical protein
MGKTALLHGVRRKLALLLDPDDARVQKPDPPPQIERRNDDKPDFDAQVNELLRRSGRPELLAGRISLINLREIEETFGPSWKRIADRAERIARATIERHLMPGDIYTGVDSLSFVVVFCSLSESAANAKCLLIADRIRKTLLGDQGAEKFAVRASVGTIEEGFRLAETRSHGPLSQDSPSHAESGFAGREPPKSGPPIDGSCPPPDERFWYRPIWHQARNVVSAYLCTERPCASADEEDHGAAAPDANLLYRRDEAARDRVLDDLDELRRSGQKCLFVLQVHFETLASAARRQAYAGALARRLQESAATLLVIAIKGAPVGIPQSRLVDIIATLRPYSRGVLLRLPIDATEMGNLRGCGLTAVGCDIGDCSNPEYTVFQHMNRFSRAAEVAGLSTYLLGANTRSIVAAAVGAGFRYVGGDAVAGPVDRPDQLLEFRLADLYRPFLQA